MRCMSSSVVVARLSHETNTFARATSLDSFYEDIDGTPAQAMVNYLTQNSISHQVACIATANPSGLVSRDAFEHYANRILSCLGENKDARTLLLDLHGAMVLEDEDDGEGHLLKRIRAEFGSLNIGVVYDLHGNVSSKMVDLADAMTCFRTYPHIDMIETGARLCQLMLEMEKERPVTKAFERIDVMSHTMQSNTSQGAMKEAEERARAWENKEGVWSVDVFAGFSLSDTNHTGMSVVSCGFNKDMVKEAAKDVSSFILDNKQRFVYEAEPLKESVRRAKAIKTEKAGPTLMLDHGDNVMSGGTATTTTLLQEVLEQKVGGKVAFFLTDKHVKKQVEGKQGQDINYEFEDGFLLDVKVEKVTQGKFKVRGPIYNGQTVDLKGAALLRHGNVLIVVCGVPFEPYDVGVFECVGLDPTTCSHLALKSRMYCRPVFEAISNGNVIECDSGGLTSSNYNIFSFKHLRPNMFPINHQ